MGKQRKISNLLALSLLTLLTERPMYPYEMAATLRHRGKDQSIKINWGSLYTVVQNLERHGFIETVEVAREGRQPERTTYRITDAGRAELTDWLRELISEPEREYTKFEAALAECAVLSPRELTGLLKQRLEALEQATAQHETMLGALAGSLPRLFLIESEYQLALRRAETGWVREVLKELTDGTFPGISDWQRFHDTGELPDDIQALAQAEREEPADS